MISIVIIIVGLIKIFKDYKKGFLRKLKGVVSMVISFSAFPLIGPYVKELVYKTNIATYLNEFNLMLINVLRTNFDGSPIQQEGLTALMSSAIVSITQAEVKILCFVSTMFIANIILTVIFSFTDLINKFTLTAQVNHILGAATGMLEFSFFTCVVLAFVYVICIYVESPVIMEILESDQLLNYVYINNPIVNSLFK